MLCRLSKPGIFLAFLIYNVLYIFQVAEFAKLNFEAKLVESFTIVSEDSGVPPMSVSLHMTVTIKDVPELPWTVILSNNRVS